MAKVTVDYVIRLEDGNQANLLGESPRIKGDIVAMKVRPHKGFGRKIRPPTYGILTVTDIDCDVACQKCQRNHTEMDENGEIKWQCRAGNWINLDSLNERTLAALREGALSMSSNEFVSRCNDRVAMLRALNA